MYQIEVKALLVKHRFRPSAGWRVTMDLDAMELGIGGIHPPGKLERAADLKKALHTEGVTLGAHPDYKRADLVAVHSAEGTWVLEVEGDSGRPPLQAMYSSIAQVMLAMTRFGSDIAYGIAVPDSPEWERQLRKVPAPAQQRLGLRLLLVSSESVRELPLRL